MNNIKFKYHFLKYNAYGVLRPNLPLMLIFGFICKDFFMILIVGSSVLIKAGNGGSGSDLINMVSPVFFFADLPVLALFYALNFRHPDGGDIPRFLWRFGSYLIIFSIILYTLILFSLREYSISNLSVLDGVVCLINIGILYYILSSEIIKDIFAEFPTRTSKKTRL